MGKGVMYRLTRLLRPPASIQWRLFWLLGGVSLGTLLVVNLAWLPGAIHDIREAQSELQRVAVRGVRDQIRLFLQDKAEALKSQAMLFRPPLLMQDQEALRLLANRFFQREPAFVEVGILNAQGQERLKVSRLLAVTDRDLGDASTSAMFQEGMQRKLYWGPVVTTETSEPWVTLALPIEGAGSTIAGVVYGVVNLKSLWEVIGEFQLSHGGRAYVVDQLGQLIATDDANLVLKRLSFADRPLVQHFMQPPSPQDLEFVQGGYVNEYGVRVTATGLRLPGMQWGVVVEQPQSILYAPIAQKLWFTAAFSIIGMLASLGIAHVMSQRFTRPIIQLRAGVVQFGSGHLTHQMTIETNDEIGDLAHQFNQMAERLRASYDALERQIAELETTVRKLQETQEQLHMARDASDEANRAKSQFLANMSHELRTPLNAIIGYSEMLIEDAEDQEQPETILDLKKIHLAGKHLLALISDILDLSKIEAGKMDICLETFDVSNLINEVVSTVQPIVAANASTLHLKVAADIGTMHSDLTKIRQSMLNLLSNACKFTEQGTIWLQADRETVDGSDWLTFRIRDTGIGMTLEQMEKLFKEFVQADSSTTRKYGGTGLGLAITRRFCRMLGGDVVVESALGQGSTFTIRLPENATQQEAKPEASMGETRIASPAEAVPRATREYLPNVSYESRPPLNGMLGMTALALDTEPTSEQRQCLTVVKASGNSC